MKVLVCHNHYQQPGGEDQSFAQEANLLEARGHEVLRYTLHNDVIDSMGRTRVALKTIYNRQTYREVRAIVGQHRPDVMHCTNTFPLISPAAYYAAHAEGVAVVQSLRNYRQLCPSALLMRDDRPCEDCLGKLLAWPGIVHKCYRGSRAATAVVAGMTALHHLTGTWRKAVDQYFTLTEFSRQKFLSAGWPGERITVKPNFVDPDPRPGDGDGQFAIFVGRLSTEKGITALLDAWRQLPRPIPLKIIGQGPSTDEVARFCIDHPHVELLGHRPYAETLDWIGRATFLVMPSIWYETFGRTIIEAFAKQTPVLASNLGAMAELIDDGVTGRLFAPGKAADLASKATAMWNDHATLQRMRIAARREYERRYTAAYNYEMLLDIYRQAIARRRLLQPVPATL